MRCKWALRVPIYFTDNVIGGNPYSQWPASSSWPLLGGFGLSVILKLDVATRLLELGGYHAQWIHSLHPVVNLTLGEISEETPGEALLLRLHRWLWCGCLHSVGSDATGSDLLGLDNMLDFATGLLTGRAAPTGTRWTVVGKLPLTGGWADANGGDYFGSALKAAGYNAIFFSDVADKLIYLFVDDG